MAKLVAIHQPNFFPWLGYFDKLRRADVFIVLDHVQYSKTSGNWGNRVQFLIAGQPRYVTMPIRRDYRGVRQVNEMLSNDQTAWREDMIKTLRANYGRAKHFAEVFPVIEPLVLNPTDNLADYNVTAIRALCQGLKIDPGKLVYSSQLSLTSTATDLLVDLVRAVGGNAYLNGGGASGYLEPERFLAAGVELIQQSFVHPTYRQHGALAFVPGLSCLDALFNCGFDGTAALLSPPLPTEFAAA